MKEPWEWEEEDILRLVKDRVSESISLEFKRCDALKNILWKKELAKDVSALANSAGGTIIYGIIEDRDTHEAESIDGGFNPSDLNIETIEQVINSGIQRRIMGVTCKGIPLRKHSPGKVLYLIHVPESSHAPHMVSNRFYKRHNFVTTLMEEYEVRERYRRETFPGKEIIEAWRDDAINPLIRILESEEVLLKKELWSLNRNKKTFDGLSLMSNQANVSANMEDFINRHPAIGEMLSEHDIELVTVNHAGEVLFEKVGTSSFIRDAFAWASSEDSLLALKAKSRNILKGNVLSELHVEVFGSNWTEQGLLDFLTEALINGVLDSNIESWLLFWNEHGQRFRKIVIFPPLSEYYRKVAEARDKMLHVTQSLISALKKTRTELSERHNVAVAPSRRVFDDPYLSLGARSWGR